MSPVWNRRQYPIAIAHSHSATVPEYVPPTLFNRSTGSVRRVQRWYSSLMTPINFLLAVLVPVYIPPNKLTVMREYVPSTRETGLNAGGEIRSRFRFRTSLLGSRSDLRIWQLTNSSCSWVHICRYYTLDVLSHQRYQVKYSLSYSPRWIC